MLLDILTGAPLPGLYVFFAFGCWASWMAGKASAQTWRTMGAYLAYALVLGFGMQFLHYALYQGPIASLPHYLLDTAVLAVIGILGYRYTRTAQMVRQYHWMYEKASPFSWKAKPGHS